MSGEAAIGGAGHGCIVLGFPRSGTTLLRRLLDAHPEVSCPPETNLVAACGRFLREDAEGEGPPVGVLAGLAFAGIEAEAVFDPLRALVFGLHRRIAGDKPVWVEKSGFDIFYLDAVTQLFAGQCRFIAMVRNPLDVIVSVKNLTDSMAQILPELRPFLQRHPNPYVAFAEAWIERNAALDDFVAARPADCLKLRYEDLLADPEAVLARLFGFLGVAHVPGLAEAVFRDGSKVGLGDFRTYESRAIDASRVDRWRTELPRATAARLLPRLAPLMAANGYAAPRLPKPPSREVAIRQFELAKLMQQSGPQNG